MMRHPLKQSLRVSALLLAAVMLLAGCGGTSSGNGRPSAASAGGGKPGGRVINLGFTTAWGDMDPYYSTSGTMYELALYDKLYDRLAFTDKAGAEILPRAALSWESGEDGMSAVFHLNPEARWSDGEPVTARDWVFTVRLLADPDCAFSTRVFTALLTGTDETGACLPGEDAGVEAPDDETFVLRFKEPMDVEDFLLHFNRQFFVLPEHLLGETAPAGILDSEFWKNPVGSGPCVFRSQILGAEMTLGRNTHYPLGNANWDTLILHVLDSSSRLTALMSGEIDQFVLGTGITANDKPLAESNGLSVREAQVRDFFMEILINESGIPDPRIRQALHYAIDKNAVVDAAAKDVGVPAWSYELPNSDYHDPSLAFERDIDKAKALLTEAGYDGHAFSFAFASKRENLAALLAQQWEEAGIHVELNVVDVVTMFSGLAEGKYDLGISGHSATAYSLWFEGEFPANDNDAPDAVRADYVEQISTCVDREKKIELVRDYQQYLAGQTWFIPLYFSGDYWVYPSRLTGVRSSASLMCNDNVWEWRIR